MTGNRWRQPTSSVPRGKQLRSAIIGAGLMGRWHADSVRRVGGRVTLVVDPVARRGRRLARDYGAKFATALSEVPDSELPEIIHLCTPIGTHEELACEVINRRRHLLVEKPLAESAEAAAVLLRRAQTEGVLVCPTHQCLFQEGIKQLFRADLGRIYHIEATICSAGARSFSEQDRCRLISEVLPHPLSLFGRFTGLRLADLDWNVIAPVPGEMHAVAQAGGVALSLLVSNLGRPTIHMLRLIAQKGTAHADLFHGFAFVERGGTSRVTKMSRPFLASAKQLLCAGSNLMNRAVEREYAYPGLRELIRTFYGAVQSGQPAPFDVAEILDIAATSESIMDKLHRRSDQEQTYQSESAD